MQSLPLSSHKDALRRREMNRLVLECLQEPVPTGIGLIKLSSATNRKRTTTKTIHLQLAALRLPRLGHPGLGLVLLVQNQVLDDHRRLGHQLPRTLDDLHVVSIGCLHPLHDRLPPRGDDGGCIVGGRQLVLVRGDRF